MQNLTARLAQLDNETWRSVVSRMNWHIRTAGAHPQPAELGDTPILVGDWMVLRRDVKNLRRAAARVAKEKAAEAARIKRRDYMRGYMRRYRIKENGSGDST